MTTYAIIDGAGSVINRVVADPGWSPPEGTTAVIETDTTYDIGGTLINGDYTPPSSGASPPTPVDLLQTFRAAIQSHIDAMAQTRGYDSGVSLAGYVTSTNAVWAAEAQAFAAWRDAVWAYAYDELDKVTSGERETLSVDDFLDELPPMVWPE